MEDKNKQNKPNKWKVYYECVLFMLFGFWVGIVFRGSESSIMKNMLEHDFVSNFAVILAILVILYPIINYIISRQKKK